MRWTEEEIDIIKSMYEKHTDAEIAEFLPNRTIDSISTKRKRLGLHCRIKYDFSEVVDAFERANLVLISDESEYKNMCSELRYICKNHPEKGEQISTYGRMLEGKGCFYCGRETTANARKALISDEDIFDLCNKNGFEYVGKDYSRKSLDIKYICKRHRSKGIQIMKYQNMKREIHGCPDCGREDKPLSKGENEVLEYLTNNNIEFIREKTFDDCKDINYLPFDFYLPSKNIAIEFDGEHHYKSVQFNGISQEEADENHRKTKLHDKMKTEYCNQCGVKLIRIPFTERGRIGDFLCTKI